MDRPELIQKTCAHIADGWEEAVRAVNPTFASQIRWDSLEGIALALRSFLRGTPNHCFLPSGEDSKLVCAIRSNSAVGCLDFHADDGHVYVGQPFVLSLNTIPHALQESFLVLELSELEVSDATSFNSGACDGGSIMSIEQPRQSGGSCERGVPAPLNQANVWNSGQLVLVRQNGLLDRELAAGAASFDAISIDALHQRLLRV